MARRLKMAEITTIRMLHQSGYSYRRIAKLVGVHRETVARYVADEDSKPANPVCLRTRSDCSELGAVGTKLLKAFGGTICSVSLDTNRLT